MADAEDRVIEISGDEWSIVDAAPVVFRRAEVTAALPGPISGGDLGKLWSHVNVTRDDRPVLLAALVAALIQPDVAHVIIALLAEHGCAKTTTAKRLVAPTDPSAAPLSMPPRDIDSWVHTANGSWVVAVDNVSTVSQWWSDALCRAATGDAMTKRRLYTDADLAVLKFRGCVILTGIDLGGLSGDLCDRLALVELDRINADNRRAETPLDAEWERDYPVILGSLLDLAAKVHAMLPNITVARLPRMADFAKVLACVDAIGGTAGFDRYRERSARLSDDSLASDSFIAEVIASRYSCADVTAREILAAFNAGDDKSTRRPVDWPRNARVVTTRLTRHAPGLRRRGWRIDHDGGQNKACVTQWTITPPEKGPDSALPDLPNLPSQVSAYESGRSDETLFPADNLPALPNLPSAPPVTSADGSAGQAGQESGPSLVTNNGPLQTMLTVFDGQIDRVIDEDGTVL